MRGSPSILLLCPCFWPNRTVKAKRANPACSAASESSPCSHSLVIHLYINIFKTKDTSRIWQKNNTFQIFPSYFWRPKMGTTDQLPKVWRLCNPQVEVLRRNDWWFKMYKNLSFKILGVHIENDQRVQEIRFFSPSESIRRCSFKLWDVFV